MTVGVWVKDMGCAGPLTFSAHFRNETKSVTLNFNCGE
jgi:hypothetical protein